MGISRYVDFDGGNWPDTPGDAIPNGGLFDSTNFLFDRMRTARKRGGTLSTGSGVRGFRYLAANQPGTAGLTSRVMGVNIYKDASNHYKAFIGQPNLTHQAIDTTAHDNETYVAFTFASDAGGTLTGIVAQPGGASFTAAAWANARNGATNIDGLYDINEAGHLSTDTPAIRWEFQFFTPPPSNSYTMMCAIGDAGSVGINTTTRRLPSGAAVGSGSTVTVDALGAGTIPLVGDLLVVFISVKTGTVVTPPSDLGSTPYSLVATSTHGGVTGYVYTKVALGTEAIGLNPWTVSAGLDASREWGIITSCFGTPSSHNLYLLSEGADTDLGSGGGVWPLVYGSSTHGTAGTYGAYIMNYPAAATLAVTCGKPFNYLGVLVYPLKSKDRTANYPAIYGGVDLSSIVSNVSYEPTGDKSVVVTAGSQLITCTGTTFLTKADVGDMIVIRDDPASPLYAYMGQVTKIVDDTHIYVEPTPTVSGTYHTAGALKIAPAMVMEDHYGTSPLSSDIACAWQYRIVYAAPSPWNATSGVRGPTDYARSICWTTLPGETVSAHTGLYLDGLQQGFRESVMPNNFLTVPEMVGPIKAMAGLFATQLVLFGEHEIWAVQGSFVTNDADTTTTDTLQVFCQSKSVGCINKDSLQATPRGLVFASGDGVYLYDGKSAHPLMHERMANTFRDSIEAGATVLGSGMIRHNHYVLTMSDKTYMVNLDSNAWGKLSNVQIFDAIDDPSDPSKTFGCLYGTVSGDPTTWTAFTGGQLVRLDTMFQPDSTNTSDANGTAVTADLTTRSHDEGEPTSPKFYKLGIYEYYLSGAGTVTVSADTTLDPVRADFATIGTLPQNKGLAITGATNASPIVITTATHGYATGDHVMIRNVLGNTEANGKWVITVLSATTFSLNSSSGNANYTSGGTAKQDQAKTFNVKSILKTGYGIAHKFALSSTASEFEILGVKHVYVPLRQGRSS